MKEEDPEITNINPKKSSKTYKIHFNDNSVNKSPPFQALNTYPACRLKKAVRFTKNWEKVTCDQCKDYKRMQDWSEEQRLMTLFRLNQEDSFAFIHLFIEPSNGESLIQYRRRYNSMVNISSERWLLENELNLKERMETIDCVNFSVLPLDDKELKFPIYIHEVWYNAEYDNDPALELNKELYKKILLETKSKIENQLKLLDI